MAFLNVASRLPSVDGLFCTDFMGDDLQCTTLFYTFGAMADSFYEYTLKQWILSRGQDTVGAGQGCLVEKSSTWAEWRLSRSKCAPKGTLVLRGRA